MADKKSDKSPPAEEGLVEQGPAQPAGRDPDDEPAPPRHPARSDNG